MNAPTSSPTRSPRISADTLTVEELDDRQELQEFLIQDKLANAYLLGDLDPDYFPFCHWYGTRAPDGTLDSILCHYTGLSLPAVLAIGSEVGVETLLTTCHDQLPGRTSRLSSRSSTSSISARCAGWVCTGPATTTRRTTATSAGWITATPPRS
ncbi:MAG: hypothetical protein ABEK29_10460 [Bradymonadaceae bacterium]